MLASITPLGERGRGRRWGVSAPAYVVGSAIGGLLVGGLAGTVGWLLRPVLGTGPAVLLVLTAAAVLAVVVDVRLSGRRVPGPRRQVNEDWLEYYREWVYGGGFGLQLGMGVMTQVPTAGIWLMLLAGALTGSPVLGGLVGLVFGVVRALPLLATRGVTNAAALQRLHRASAAWERRGRWLDLGVLATTAATLVALVVVDVVGRSNGA